MNESENVVPLKKVKQRRKSEVIRDKKVQGLEHKNHKGTLIPRKTLGEDCK